MCSQALVTLVLHVSYLDAPLCVMWGKWEALFRFPDSLNCFHSWDLKNSMMKTLLFQYLTLFCAIIQRCNVVNFCSCCCFQITCLFFQHSGEKWMFVYLMKLSLGWKRERAGNKSSRANPIRVSFLPMGPFTYDVRSGRGEAGPPKEEVMREVALIL